MASTTSAAPGVGARVRVQQFGTFLSNMVMPNIGAFIAWGLITAMFIEVGWLPRYLGIGDSPDSWVAKFGGWGDFAGGGIVGPMIIFLLPLLIGYTGGRMGYGDNSTRGGVVGAIATMGVIVGTDIPMFMGAMIMGPLGGWSMRKVDSLWDGKIKPGFEMLVNNFAAGIWGMVLTILGFVVMSPVVTWIADRLGGARVTLVVFVLQALGTLGVLYAVYQLEPATSPEAVAANGEVFGLFLATFLFVFAMTGFGNGSTFKMIPAIWRTGLSRWRMA